MRSARFMGAAVAGALALMGLQSTTASGSTPSAAPATDDVVLAGVVQLADATVSGGLASKGTVRNVRGATGAKVTLTYLDLENTKVGDEVTPVVLAQTVADASGQYALRLTPRANLLRRIESNSSYLNAELGVAAGGQADSQSVSVYWNGKSWGHPTRSDQSAGRKYSSVLARDPRTGKTTGSLVVPSGGQVAGVAAATVPCSFIVTGKPTRYTKVIEFHSTTATSGGWRYGQTADSDVEAGLNMSGTAGWKVSGTSHVGTSVGAYAGADASGKLVGYYGTTNMEYTEGYYKPYGTYTSTTTCSGLSVKPMTKSLKATKWLAGTSSTANVTQFDCFDSPQKSYRNIQSAGSVFGTSSARASRYSGAASFSYISLGATSGFSTNVSLDWKWDKGRGGYACGYNAYPPYAKIIYVN